MLYHLDAYIVAHKIARELYIYEAKQDVPEVLIHCIADVADRYSERDDAWVIAKRICIATLQDKGYLKPGTMQLTKKGRILDRKHRREKEKDDKFDKYLRYYRRYRRYLKQQRESKKK